MSLQDPAHFLFMEIRTASRISVLSKVCFKFWLIYSRKLEFGMVLQIHAIYKVEHKLDMVLQLVKPRLHSVPRNDPRFRLLQSMSRICVASVNKSPHIRIKRNSQREKADENI